MVLTPVVIGGALRLVCAASPALRLLPSGSGVVVLKPIAPEEFHLRPAGSVELAFRRSA